MSTSSRSDEVQSALARFGDRYLDRVSSPPTRWPARRIEGEVRARRLAARFAAKEATMKALGPGATGSRPGDRSRSAKRQGGGAR